MAGDRSARIASFFRLQFGALLVALTGVGMVVYAAAFIVRNFTHLIELGFDEHDVGFTRQELEAFSPEVVDYLSHVQVNLGAFIASTGLAIILLAWFGIARGASWAWWGVIVITLTWAAIGGSIHYVYDLAPLTHVAPGYFALALLAVGLYLSHPRRRRRDGP